MTEWWNGLTNYEIVLFIIAAAGTLIMIVQLLFMLIGGIVDSGTSFDADVDVDAGGAGDSVNSYSTFTLFGLKILTTRTAIAFFTIGSWMAFAMANVFGDNQWISIFPGIGAGIIAAFLIALMMRAMEKSQQSGNVSIRNAIGKPAEVYLTIPPLRSGNGKVSIFVQERYVEYEAVTDSTEPLKTGTHVKVIDVLNDGTVIVVLNNGSNDKLNDYKEIVE